MTDNKDKDKKIGMFYGAIPIIFERAKELRKIMTEAEEIIWGLLKENPLECKFRRQHPIAMYIADFYCHSIRLVIEIDGEIHLKEDVKANDKEREYFLKSLGLEIIRFTNKEVFQDSNKVYEAIIHKIKTLQKKDEAPAANGGTGLGVGVKASLGVGVKASLGGGRAVRVYVPATIANLVCGFDVLGLAVDAPTDEMELTLLDTPTITIKHIDAFGLPTKPEENVAGVALLALLEAYENKNIGFAVTINKIIKPGSGLGSSAASAAGAVVAANYLLGNPFSKSELVQFAMYGEKLASGVKHADNITPCIYGGVTLIRSIHPLDIIPIAAPPLYVTIVHPQIEVKTADARQILRKDVQLKDAIKQWGNVAGLVAGFLQNDYELISRSLEDVIVEPIRSILIPGFDEVKAKSKAVGALGGGISGSGPAIFMLSQNEIIAKQVADVMNTIYTKIGIAFYTYITKVNTSGCTITS